MNLDENPIHHINLYLPPWQKERVLLIVRNLCWIVTARILRKDPHAKIVITGDFNAYGLPLVIKALRGTDLEPVIPLDEPTHNRGGYLDDIFTNLAATGT